MYSAVSIISTTNAILSGGLVFVDSGLGDALEGGPRSIPYLF